MNNNCSNYIINPYTTPYITPSKNALALSTLLKTLSSRKNFREAISHYCDPSNDSIKDVHHCSIIVDCCARCGNVKEAENIVCELSRNNCKKSDLIPVQVNTALMKAYSRAGMVGRCYNLFMKMLSSKDKRNSPNIRTLNTLLRGCVWNAAHLHFSEKREKNEHFLRIMKGSVFTKCLDNVIVGGVITSETVWDMITTISSHSCQSRQKITFDVSSYEYSISLLCQTLMVDIAEIRLNDMIKSLGVIMEDKNLFCTNNVDKEKINTSFTYPDESVLEPLAFSYVCMARAHALLGRRIDSKKNSVIALKIIHYALQTLIHKDERLSGKALNPGFPSEADVHGQKIRYSLAMGGKRSWKRKISSQFQEQYEFLKAKKSQREISNREYRKHRLREFRAEASSIKSISQKKKKSYSVFKIKTGILAKYLLSRFLCFPYVDYDSTTPVEEREKALVNTAISDIDKRRKDHNSMLLQMQRIYNGTEYRSKMITPLWISFGLSKSVGVSLNWNNVLGLQKLKTEGTFRDQDYEALRKHVGKDDYLLNSILTNTGSVNFDSVFHPFMIKRYTKELYNMKKETNSSLTLHIELGAGTGDWIIQQAKANPNENYVAVDFRADRVSQIFSKCMLSDHLPLNNVCCVYSDCYNFLHRYVKKSSVKTVFINYPEPPTQTYGVQYKNDIEKNISEGEEPLHMLNSKTIIAVEKCLQKSGTGRLVIVSDNRSYANLICLTLKYVIENKYSSLASLDLRKQTTLLRVVEIYPVSKEKIPDGKCSSPIFLYKGKPSEVIGHFTAHKGLSLGYNYLGSSYFDRLWNSGVGKYSEGRNRFIIVMKRSVVECSGNNILCLKKNSFSEDYSGCKKNVPSYVSIQACHNTDNQKRKGKKRRKRTKNKDRKIKRLENI